MEKSITMLNDKCLTDFIGLPLLSHNEAIKELIDMADDNDSILLEDFYINPIYQVLPNTDGLTDKEKQKYPFKKLKEDFYLVGAKIISDKWVHPNFCGRMLESCGLYLSSANVLSTRGEKYMQEKPLIELTFKHVSKFV